VRRGNHPVRIHSSLSQLIFAVNPHIPQESRPPEQKSAGPSAYHGQSHNAAQVQSIAFPLLPYPPKEKGRLVKDALSP